MKIKIAIAVFVLLKVGFAVWFFYFRITKEKALEIIGKSGNHSDVSALASHTEDYLIAWAKAIKANKETFELNNKQYKTLGGRAV